MKYILVQWPESQCLMEHERFDECLLVDSFDEEDDIGSSAYMCPEDLYNEIFPEARHTQMNEYLVKVQYHRGGVCMAELLAQLSAEGMTIEDAFLLYVSSMKWAEGDRFYRLSGQKHIEL